MQPEAIEQAIGKLSTRYGTPLCRAATVDGMFDPVAKTDRYGEVCMVIRRPSGRLLTARKTFYPPHAYRLLTGGVAHGEHILDALLREIEEETGLTVEVRRLLAVVEYRQRTQHPHAPSDSSPLFYTFAWLVDELHGTLACADPDERVADFREVTPDDLPILAATLEHLDDTYDDEIAGSWRDWGRFRAVIHHVVHEALTIFDFGCPCPEDARV